MKEHKSKDNLKEIIQSELFERSEQIAKEVEAYKASHQYEFPEDLDLKVMERIQQVDHEQEAYEKLSEEDKEALRIGKEIIIQRELDMDDEVYEEENTDNVVNFRRKKKPWKVYFLVAVVVIMVLAMGMTSIGGRPFILEMMNDAIGENRKVTRINSENEELNNNLDEISEEEKFYQQVEDTFDINFVRLGYIPQGTTWRLGDVDTANKWCCEIFEYQGKTIQYQMFINYRKSSFGYDVEDEITKRYSRKINEVDIEIIEHKLPDGTKEFLAEFEYKDVYYIINAPVSEAEFKKILKNLNFF